MATANSNAQREPSMEEILASIRRIIEDSDTGRKAPLDMSEEQPEASSTEAAPHGEVEAFRAELRPEPEAHKPVSMAEVQARIAPVAREPAPTPLRLADVAARMVEEPSVAVPETSPAAASAGRDDEPAATAAAPDAEAAADGEDASAPEFSAGASLSAQESWAAGGTAGSDEPAEIAAADTVDEYQHAAASAAPRPALISQQTSRQVAAAFEELSEHFASRSRQSFDEMAEEMLRPMLQDWLDNNLPTLVERLVREEIERVARGG